MAERPACPACRHPLEVRQYQYEVLVWDWDEAASRYQKRVTGQGADAPECSHCGHHDWNFLLDTTDDEAAYDYVQLGLYI